MNPNDKNLQASALGHERPGQPALPCPPWCARTLAEHRAEAADPMTRDYVVHRSRNFYPVGRNMAGEAFIEAELAINYADVPALPESTVWIDCGPGQSYTAKESEDLRGAIEAAAALLSEPADSTRPVGAESPFGDWETCRPFFPLPLPPEREGLAKSIALKGTCQPYCATLSDVGRSVGDHGPCCLSTTVGAPIEGLRNDGQQAEIWLDLWAPYLYGTYDKEATQQADAFTQNIRISIDPESTDPCEVSLSSVHARALAATLIRAADWVDFNDEPGEGKPDNQSAEARGGSQTSPEVDTKPELKADHVYSTAKAAPLLGICGQNLRAMCETGEITNAYKIPSASGKRFAWRIPGSSIIAYRRTHRVQESRW